MGLGRFVLGAAVVMLLAADEAFACVCAPGDFEYSRGSAVAIFSGEVQQITDDSVVFKVREVWKGEVTKTFSISRVRKRDGCDFTFRVRQTYLVFALPWPVRERGQTLLYTRQCSRTNELGQAGDELEKLGKGRPPAAGNKVPHRPKPDINFEVQH